MDLNNGLPQLRNDQPIPPSYAERFPVGYLDQSRGHIILGTAISFIVIDTVMVTLRFCARWIQRSSLRVDDYLVLAGLVFCWGLDSSYICSALAGGTGRHIEYVMIYPERYAVWRKIDWISVLILFLMACAMSKLAVLYVYHSIFINKKDLMGCKIVAIFIIVSTIIEVPIPIFQCKPIYGLWNMSVESTCLEKVTIVRYGPIPNLLSDVALILLPLRTVRTIQVPLRVKIGIFVTFLAGGIGLVVCIAHLAILFQPLNDEPWQGTPLVLCTIAEATTYLMSACLLQIRPLLTFLFRETPLSKIRAWTLTTNSRTRLDATESRRRKTTQWNSSGINLHSIANHTSKESAEGRDGIVVTNEYTVAYDCGTGDGLHQSESSNSVRPTEQV